jgi:hypothetical protein
MQKMILLPYDKYQRLLSHASKPSPDTETHLQENTEERTPSGSTVEQNIPPKETGDQSTQTVTPRKRKAQIGKGDIPPPPGIPAKRIKWLKL